MQESPPHKRLLVGCSSPFTRLAETPHGASRVVLVKTRHAPSRHCRDARGYGVAIQSRKVTRVRESMVIVRSVRWNFDIFSHLLDSSDYELFCTNGVTSGCMKYSVTTPCPRCIRWLDAVFSFFSRASRKERFSGVFLYLVLVLHGWMGRSRLFFLPWIQRDLRQEDIICGCLPYWYLFQPFFMRKRR